MLRTATINAVFNLVNIRLLGFGNLRLILQSQPGPGALEGFFMVITIKVFKYYPDTIIFVRCRPVQVLPEFWPVVIANSLFTNIQPETGIMFIQTIRLELEGNTRGFRHFS